MQIGNRTSYILCTPFWFLVVLPLITRSSLPILLHIARKNISLISKIINIKCLGMLYAVKYIILYLAINVFYMTHVFSFN